MTQEQIMALAAVINGLLLKHMCQKCADECPIEEMHLQIVELIAKAQEEARI